MTSFLLVDAQLTTENIPEEDVSLDVVGFGFPVAETNKSATLACEILKSHALTCELEKSIIK